MSTNRIERQADEIGRVGGPKDDVGAGEHETEQHHGGWGENEGTTDWYVQTQQSLMIILGSINSIISNRHIAKMISEHQPEVKLSHKNTDSSSSEEKEQSGQC